MKNSMRFLMLSMSLLWIVTSCDQLSEENEEPANVYEKIKGTWTINKMNMFGVDIPGDGSTLTFEQCDEPPCIGRDYEATDETTGEFTYEFIENESKILIVDEDENGGNYNATWAILDFESKSLRMTGEFGIFGNMQVEMNK